MRQEFLPFSPPTIGDAEIDEVVDTLRSPWVTTGPKVKRFEDEFARFLGAPAALALNSCTAALHVALKALDVGSGDAVITTPMTFCASVNVIEHCGARPILVDVEPDTLNLDPQQVASALERARAEGVRVRAIMPVHLYGHPADMDALFALASRYHVAIVEDAAHAFPAAHGGHRIGGAHADIDVPVLTAFSFYATKNLTTVEGGMLTGPADLLADARVWSLHGMSRDAWKRYSKEGSWYYEVLRPGFKYNMTDLQASIGLHQLTRIEEFQRRRAAIVEHYNEAFRTLPHVQVPVERDRVLHAWHIYALRVRPECFRWVGESEDRGNVRRRFIEEMTARNIGTSVHFIPVPLHPYYRDKYGFAPRDFPVATAEFERLVSLPLHPGLTDADVEDVVDAVRDIVRVHGC